MRDKPIRLSAHAAEQAKFRGATVEEIAETIRTAEWTPAERGRLEARRAFAYMLAWNGKMYTGKIVRPVFVEEDDAIVVVTVYTYYSNEEVRDEDNI